MLHMVAARVLIPDIADHVDELDAEDEDRRSLSDASDAVEVILEREK